MEKKNIVIDRGNSSFKAGLFAGEHLQSEFATTHKEELIRWVNEQSPSFIMVSSVSGDMTPDLDKYNDAAQVLVLDSHTPLPFKNLYKTPGTLGPDRLAAVAGAFSLAPNQNCLVIDAGTCITYDFIDSNGSYRGGGISPGLRMRLQALHQFTAGLPLAALPSHADLIGADTLGSITSGVVNGAVAEVEGIIAKYLEKHGDTKVFLCGGDTFFFESKLKQHIFAVANLVLIGLNRILLYNT